MNPKLLKEEAKRFQHLAGIVIINENQNNNGNRYNYKNFKFEVDEEGMLNMIFPEFYEGQSILEEEPTFYEIKSVISDYYDLKNREIPLSPEEIMFINTNFDDKEKEEIFGTIALVKYPSIYKPYVF